MRKLSREPRADAIIVKAAESSPQKIEPKIDSSRRHPAPTAHDRELARAVRARRAPAG